LPWREAAETAPKAKRQNRPVEVSGTTIEVSVNDAMRVFPGR
jgi:hypothetical protein